MKDAILSTNTISKNNSIFTTPYHTVKNGFVQEKLCNSRRYEAPLSILEDILNDRPGKSAYYRTWC